MDFCYGHSWDVGVSSLIVWAAGAFPSKDTLWTSNNGKFAVPGCQWSPDHEAPAAALHVAGALRVQEQDALLEVTQNDVHVGCDLRVDGDLSVSGNTVTTDTIVVDDHTIELAPNGPADGGGIVKIR